MQGKLIVMVSFFCMAVSLCFAQEAKSTTDVKDSKAVSTPAKVEMPKMPEIDPKAWDFLPEVVATVGETKITKTDLVKVLNPQAKMMLMMGQKFADNDYKNLAKGLIQELIKATIVKDLAASEGYKATPEMENQVYNKFIENMKKQMPDSKGFNFEDMIKQQGLTVADVKKQMTEGEVVHKWVDEKIIPGIKIADSDVKAFYDKNKENLFKRPETVTASHILFKPKESTKKAKKVSDASTKESIDEKAWADAKMKAERVLKSIKNRKLTFEEAVKKHSEGPSKDNGGQLGTFAKGQMVPEFESVCWSLANGKLNEYELAKTQFGWHIIKVTAYDKGGYVDFDEKVAARIKEKLKQEAVFKKVNEMIDAQIKKLNPVVNIK